MSLILIRHGETALNASRTLQFPDTPLGERGLLQAAAVGERFRAQPPVAIVSSDMARARMTAEAISRTTGLPVIESPLLGERNFGDLRGRAFDSLGYDPIHADEGPPNGESMAQFRARVAQAYDWIMQMRRRVQGDLAIVSHGLFIRQFIEGHTHVPPGLVFPERLENTAVTIMAAEPPHTVQLMGCAVHLSGAASGDGRGVVGV
ncbi:MAG: histidine phosphatase family protein [Burkholderiales bacterium]|jgi:broad specificity phosphatase PhoE